MSAPHDEAGEGAGSPVTVLDVRRSHDPSRPPGWLMLVVGAGLGAAAVVVTMGGIEPTATAAPTSVPTATTTEPTVVDSTVPVAPPTETPAEPEFRFPRGVLDGRVLAITGTEPSHALEVWLPGHLPATAALPPGAGGDLGVDASGLAYSFTGRSADLSAYALYVGRGTGYAPVSAMVRGHAWHPTAPFTIAWIDVSAAEPVIRVDYVNPAGELADPNENRKVVPARRGDRLVSYDDHGFVVFSFGDRIEHPDRVEYEPNRLQRLSDNGALQSEVDAEPLAFAGSGHGLVAFWDEAGGRRLVTVDPLLAEVAQLDIATNIHVSLAAWSPDGDTVALIETTIGSSGGMAGQALTTWTEDGDQSLAVPLPDQVWNLTWSRDGATVLMLSRDGPGGATALLLVDTATGVVEAIPMPDRVSSVAILGGV